MSETWNVRSKIILPNDEEIEIEGPITAVELSNAVKAAGISQFITKDIDGRPLKPVDFPVSHDVYVEEYNEAKK